MAGLFLLLCVPAFAQADRPASIISVTDAYLPYQVVLDGFVILDISLDSRGTVAAIHVLRDPGSLVSAAISSVRTWKFEPRIKDGKPRPSEMTAVFVYRPADCGGAKAAPLRFDPVLPRFEDAAQTPIGIVSIAYPEYPVNSVAWGSVILQASIDKAGAIKKTEVLRGQEPFTAFSIESLKRWVFQPSMLQGKPTESNVAVAFVFQGPCN